MKNYITKNEFDLFDSMFDNFFAPKYYSGKSELMKTDIKEDESGYAMEIEVPGFDKKDIRLALDDGYLTISANKQEEKDGEEDKKGNYIRRERSFSYKRSYYVGDVKQEDIKAKYDNGILNVFIPKEQPKLKTTDYIEIE